MAFSAYFSRDLRPYTGVELRPHFLLTEFGLRGSALAAFLGPCEVKTDHLVDWEDRLAGDHIRARMMVHFIGEFFGESLREAVLRQRLFMASLGQSLNAYLDGEVSLKPDVTQRVTRNGDDLFWNQRKLSVSIVTASPVSQLLHVGINVDPTGAPVPAVGLEELGVSPELWVPQVLESFAEEWEGMEWACAKVRPVI